MKCSVDNTEDNENGLFSCKSELFEDIFDIEDRYEIFTKADSTDKEISRKAYAFKFNGCAFREGSKMRENTFMRKLKSETSMTERCPLRKGLVQVHKDVYSDTLFPPVPSEIQVRCHKEVFGKLKEKTKWTKLYTEDTYFRVKK
jgi:hypothetical protein